MKISPARTAAFDILLRIEREKSYSSVLLPTYEDNLAAADRALCHELVLGSLRRQILLDREIDVLTGNKKLDIEVRVAIRLGLYQLRLLTKVPQYSALNESVHLVQRAKKTSAKSLVNAVLRKASREKVELTFTDEIERISVEQSHPRWLIEKWANAIGIEQAEKLAAANNTPPPTAFRIIGEPTDDVALLLKASRRSEFVDGCYIWSGGPLRSVSIYIQDEASQMTALAVSVPSGGKFLDVCAAPGGKTGLIAQRAGTGLVVAGEIHSHRVKFLQENCRKQGVKASVIQYNAEISMPFADETFDAVLIDAPCTGTGTIRHNPEIRYFIESNDFVDLQAKQLCILQNASKLLKKGGLLVYSTCSIEREENEDVCGQFIKDNQDFQKNNPNVPRRFITDEGFARTWPQRDFMDGFFIAAFLRQ
ncbi:MAG: 16S rRNA (cytosine(967)-C(5))-methyltransferase RsmB [Pyrinomonadaceae bacterium]